MRPRPIVLALLVVGALCVVFALPFLNRGERGSQVEFGEEVLQILDAGIHGDTEEWKADRERYAALVERTTTREDAAQILHQAALSAGGPHSQVVPLSSGILDTPDVGEMPATHIEGGLLTAVLPPFRATDSQAEKYAQTVNTALHEPGVCGIVLDLRANTGGSTTAMLPAVASLLPDGVSQEFVDRDGIAKEALEIRGSTMHQSGETFGTSLLQGKVDVPVALITGPMTGSAAEQVLLAFRGLDTAASFGAPTFGLATGPEYEQVEDYVVAVSTTRTKARTGEVFGDDPIAPDVLADPDDAVASAKEWLASRGCPTQ